MLGQTALAAIDEVIAFYRMGDDEGGTAGNSAGLPFDSSGNENGWSGTFPGGGKYVGEIATSAVDKTGSTVALDWTGRGNWRDDPLQLRQDDDTFAPVDLLDNYAIEMWVRPQNDFQENAWIYGLGGPNGVGLVQMGNVIKARNSSTGAESDFGEFAITDETLNKWVHLAVVVNNGTVEFYTNGELSAKHLEGGSPVPPGAPQRIHIGVNAGGGVHWNGALDELRVYTFSGPFDPATLLVTGGLPASGPPSLKATFGGFPLIQVDESSEINVLLQNAGTDDLVISELVIAGDNASAFSFGAELPDLPVTLAGLAVAQIPVRFTPDGTPGIQNAELQIKSNDPDDLNPDKAIAINGHAWQPDGLSFHWTLDDTGPPNASDVSGNDFTGTFVDGENWAYGVTPIAGSDGTAVMSAGGNNYMLAAPPHTPSFTYSVWIKPESGGVLFHQTRDLVQRSKSMFDVELGDDGSLIVFIGEQELFFTEANTVPIGEVTHIVITHHDSDGFETGKADRTRLYINGSLHGEVTDPAELPVFPENGPSNDTLYAGISLLGGGILQGTWDDLQRYDFEVSEGAVASMFANPGSEAGFSPLPFQVVDFSINPATNRATITWNSIPGRTYSLESTTSLELFWFEVTDNLKASDGETTSHEFTYDPNATSLFYRVIDPR